MFIHTCVESDQNAAWVQVEYFHKTNSLRSNCTESFTSKASNGPKVSNQKPTSMLIYEPNSSCDLFALICSDLNIKAVKYLASAHYKHVRLSPISTAQLSLCSQESCYSSMQKATASLRIESIAFHKSHWCRRVRPHRVSLTLRIGSRSLTVYCP